MRNPLSFLRMRRSSLAVSCAFAAALLAVRGHAADPALTPDEVQASERLAGHAREVLDAMLGPGRSKISVEVHGERVQTSSDAEFVVPLARPAEAAPPPFWRVLDLPGFDRNAPDNSLVLMQGMLAAQSQSASFFQKSQEHSLRDAGFTVKNIQVTAVLDSALSEGQVQESSKVLGQVLRLDPGRGDMLSVVRASLRPAWRSAFATPGDWRAAAFAAALVLAILLAACIGGLALVRAARAFAHELSSRRGAEGFLPAGRGEALPELVAGAPPELMAAGSGGIPGGTPALGRRFDFLAEAEHGILVSVLSKETPEDLALLFGYLAESNPETASRLFSILPPPTQGEVSQRLLILSSADPEKMSILEERLRSVVTNSIQGPERLARILSRVPGEERADLLGRLAARDAGGARSLEEKLFAFEDLETISSADLRRVITAVPYEAWGAALRGAPAALIDRVCAELPDGPRELARQGADTPQPRDKVLAVRSKILDEVSRLAASGALNLGGGASSSGELI